MGGSFVVTWLAVALALPQGSAPAGPDLAVGIAQVERGQFDAAVVTLDAFVRRVQGDSQRLQDQARANVYLGVAYLGLNHEGTARAKFLDACRADPTLSLSAADFPPRVIQVFEQVRREVKASEPPEPANRTGAVRAALSSGVRYLGGPGLVVDAKIRESSDNRLTVATGELTFGFRGDLIPPLVVPTGSITSIRYGQKAAKRGLLGTPLRVLDLLRKSRRHLVSLAWSAEGGGGMVLQIDGDYLREVLVALSSVTGKPVLAGPDDRTWLTENGVAAEPDPEADEED